MLIELDIVLNIYFNFALKIAEFLNRYLLISNLNIQDTFLDIDTNITSDHASDD